MIFNGYRYGFHRVPDFSTMLERKIESSVSYNFFDYYVNNIISFSINFELNFNCKNAWGLSISTTDLRSSKYIVLNAFETNLLPFSLLSRC